MYYRFTNIGRTFFPLPRSTPVDLGEGLEIWNGFFQSPVMGWKPYLNIDGKYKIIHNQNPPIFLFESSFWYLKIGQTLYMEEGGKK